MAELDVNYSKGRKEAKVELHKRVDDHGILIELIGGAS